MRRQAYIAKRAALLATALSVVLAAFSAVATVVVPLTRAQLVSRADLVVRATVGAQRFGWNEDHSQIITLTQLRVASYIKGAGPQELTVRQFGGRIDGLESRVAGDGELQPGQDVVLFLRQGAGVVYLTALAQSVYVIEQTGAAPAVVRRDLRDLTFAQQAQGQMVLREPPVETRESLDQFVRDVGAIVRGVR